MKNFHLPPLLCLCAVTLAISSCTLDKEPEIPTGFNTIENPANPAGEVTPDSNKFLANAWLDSLGNLNILHHGWVWSVSPGPTVEDDSLDLGQLETLSFSTEISGLDTGKLYYFRPYIINGCGVFYGKEDICSFLGVHFTINTDTEIFKGADVQFTNTTPGNCTFLWDFGDGTTSTEYSPEHTFDQITGNVTVRLTANLSGCTVMEVKALKIVPDPFEGYWTHIPAGAFLMGCTAEQIYCETDSTTSDSEIPVHQVSLNSFFLGKTEITQGQWLAVMGDNPSSFALCGPDCPVESVSWYDIVDIFLPALYRKTGRTYRLPTEAEWEYAARGGADASGMTIYAGSDSLDLVGWYLANSDSVLHPVAQKLPNGYGVYDMSGNVWEWVEDDYHISYVGAPADGSAWVNDPRSNGRMYRGGSWQSDNPEGCRIPNRGGDPTGVKRSRIGFRIARP